MLHTQKGEKNPLRASWFRKSLRFKFWGERKCSEVLLPVLSILVLFVICFYILGIGFYFPQNALHLCYLDLSYIRYSSIYLLIILLSKDKPLYTNLFKRKMMILLKTSEGSRCHPRESSCLSLQAGGRAYIFVPSASSKCSNSSPVFLSNTLSPALFWRGNQSMLPSQKDACGLSTIQGAYSTCASCKMCHQEKRR